MWSCTCSTRYPKTQTEYQLRDRLSFMHFVWLGLHGPVPDAKTLWLFREQMTWSAAILRLLARFDAALEDKGLLAMAGRSSTRRWSGRAAPR
jgi:transposase, IS5 family